MTGAAAQGASAPDPRFVPLTGQEYLDSLNDDREVWITANASATSPTIRRSGTRPG